MSPLRKNEPVEPQPGTTEPDVEPDAAPAQTPDEGDTREDGQEADRRTF